MTGTKSWKCSWLALVALAATAPAWALTAGDIAIVGYQAVDPDRLAFVALVDIPIGTVIRFTDDGWYAAGGFRANEGGIKFTANSLVTAGTVIDRRTPFNTGTWTVDSTDLNPAAGVSIALSTSGDQLIAFQGAATAPTPIYAVNCSPSGWSDATNASTSALPTGLVDGTSAVNLGDWDVAYYIGTTSNTKANLLAAIGTPANWALSNTAPIVPPSSFTVTDAATSGACCNGGSCLVKTPALCASGSGVYIGGGTTCTPNPCPPPPGACCVILTCTMETAASCTGHGGTYMGDGSVCDPNTCPISCSTIPQARAAGTGIPTKLCNVIITSTADLIPSTNNMCFQVQDPNFDGGMTVYGTNADIGALTGVVGEGDKINILGNTDSFNGLFELAGPFDPNNPNTIALISHPGVPAPVVVTSADLADGSPTATGLESMLVKVHCVTFADAGGTVSSTGAETYLATDGTSWLRVRMPNTGTLATGSYVLPSGPQDITGIFGQDNSNTGAGGGYAIWPRASADIVPATGCGTVLGACCVMTTCTVTTAAACTGSGGYYLGNGTGCIDLACPVRVERGDIAYGPSTASYHTTFQEIRAGQQIGRFGISTTPYLQAGKFDNSGGVYHAARGNLVSLNYGSPLASANPGAVIGNIATDGTARAQPKLIQFSGDPNSFKNPFNDPNGANAARYKSRGSGLSVSPNNQYLAMYGSDLRMLYVMRYNAGATPGTGTGASITQWWSFTDPNSFGTSGASSRGTAWLDNNTIMVANVITSNTQVRLNTVTFDPNDPNGAFVLTPRATVTFTNAGQFTSIAYNPQISGYVFVVAGGFTSPIDYSALAVIDPGNWTIVKQINLNNSMLDAAARDCALGQDLYLYLSQYHPGAGTPAIDRINVSSPATLADDSSTDYYADNSYTTYNGLDVAVGDPAGACCVGETCGFYTSAECTTVFSGTYLGDGTLCYPNPCLNCRNVAQTKALPLFSESKVCNVLVTSVTDLTDSAFAKSFQVQDPNNLGGDPNNPAALTVYGTNASIDAILVGQVVGVGDVISLQGTTDEFDGLFELTAPFVYYGKNGTHAVVPTVVLPTDFVDSAPNAESYESMLVQVNCVHFVETGTFAASTLYHATDDATTLAVYIASDPNVPNPLVGTAIPAGSVNIVGIFGQHDTTAPYTGGYQLLPRGPADITSCAATGACCAVPTLTCTLTTLAGCVPPNIFRGVGTLCTTPNICWCKASSNCDLVVSWRDIDYFVAAQNDAISAWYKKFLPNTPSCSYWVNDVNNDNHVSWRDITPFVQKMNMTCPHP